MSVAHREIGTLPITGILQGRQRDEKREEHCDEEGADAMCNSFLRGLQSCRALCGY